MMIFSYKNSVICAMNERVRRASDASEATSESLKVRLIENVNRLTKPMQDHGYPTEDSTHSNTRKVIVIRRNNDVIKLN